MRANDSSVPEFDELPFDAKVAVWSETEGDGSFDANRLATTTIFTTDAAATILSKIEAGGEIKLAEPIEDGGTYDFNMYNVVGNVVGEGANTYTATFSRTANDTIYTKILTLDTATPAVSWESSTQQLALHQNGINQIHALPQTATESDLVAGNYLALDNADGTKRLPAEAVAKASDVKRIDRFIFDGVGILELGKEYRRGDVCFFDGWKYKFFNDIPKIDISKRVDKGRYYCHDGKTYKCSTSSYNYVGEDPVSGEIVFKDNGLKKYNGESFIQPSISDVVNMMEEVDEANVIVANALPINDKGKRTYSAFIDISTSKSIQNPQLFAVNLPLNAKIRCCLHSDKLKHGQFTGIKENGSSFSLFGGSVYPNEEFVYYVREEIKYLSVFVAGGDVSSAGVLEVVYDVDYSPITEIDKRPVVFDTDWGGDVDDGVAVACLGYGERTGATKCVGAAISRYRTSAQGNAVIGLDAELQYYGIKNIPITSAANFGLGTGTGYNDACIAFPHTMTELSQETPTSMYRRIISSLPIDVKLDIIVVGVAYNIKNLIDSTHKTRPIIAHFDDIDPDLDGEELVNTRIGNVYYMAGCYNENGKKYDFVQKDVIVDSSTKNNHYLITNYDDVNAGDKISFKVVEDGGSISSFKVYYKDVSGANHEIPTNSYLKKNTFYEYMLTEKAVSLWMSVNTATVSGTVQVYAEINRPSLMKAEANMSMNGQKDSVGQIVTNSSSELLKKAGCPIIFLGFENNCTECGFLYGSNKTYDILYKLIDAYTGGSENKWKGLDDSGNPITSWTSGRVHGWDPLTVMLAVIGCKACGFGIVAGRNELVVNQNDLNYGYNRFYSESNGNHFYVYQEYTNQPFNNNRYQSLLDCAIQCIVGGNMDDDTIAILPRR